MSRDPFRADATAMTIADAQVAGCPPPATQPWRAVDAEPEWRGHARLLREGADAACAWERWSDRRRELRTLISPRLERHYTIEVLLSDTVVDSHQGGATVYTRGGQFGAAQVTPPGQQVLARVERPMESLILYVPLATMRETLQLCGQYLPDGFVLADPRFRADPILGRCVNALYEAANLQEPSTAPFVDHACRTVITYLARAQLHAAHAPDRPGGLQAWRLRRVMDFIGANATEAISLQAMADHAGLSRMHFAAQFLRATGMTPHTYLTQARLEIAKRLLSEGQLALAAVAVQTGFHSQAHFTHVFRKATGTTPGRWRAQARNAVIQEAMPPASRFTSDRTRQPVAGRAAPPSSVPQRATTTDPFS